MRIGSLALDGDLLVAPMAGVSDRPFRALCRRYGAALAFGEMVTNEARLWGSAKTRARRHLRDYAAGRPAAAAFWAGVWRIERAGEQLTAAARFFGPRGAPDVAQAA